MRKCTSQLDTYPQDEIRKCVTLCKEKNIDISRLALRYAFDEIDADIVLCGTAKVFFETFFRLF